MNHSKPLVMTHDMKKHRNMLLRGVDVVFKQPSLPKCVYKCIEHVSSYPKHFLNLHPKHLDRIYMEL
jgi:hypothetical protein